MTLRPPRRTVSTDAPRETRPSRGDDDDDDDAPLVSYEACELFLSNPPPPRPRKHRRRHDDDDEEEAAAGDQLTQAQLGSIGGRCAGRLGDNRFVAAVTKDSRSRCQFGGCASCELRPGDARLGKIPPSLRHGSSKKTTWYHLDCAFEAFRLCARKSKVVTSLEDIENLDALPAEDRARLAALVDDYNAWNESLPVPRPHGKKARMVMGSRATPELPSFARDIATSRNYWVNS